MLSMLLLYRTIEAPPGYIQTVVNKIVSNIRIYCNNLILKYVEEDIVLSMNVKLLTFESADAKWESAYSGNTTNIYILLYVHILLNYRYISSRSYSSKTHNCK